MQPKGLSGVLDRWAQSLLEEIHTISIGKIVSYSGHKTRRAQVLPLVNPWLATGEVIRHKPIDNVPVVFPSTSTAGMILPVKPGDFVLLMFAENGIGGILDSKSADPVDADGVTRFSYTDCIAVPGLWPFSQVFDAEVPDGAVGVFNGKTKMVLLGDRFSIEDGSGNTVSSSGSKITVNGNLEVSQ